MAIVYSRMLLKPTAQLQVDPHCGPVRATRSWPLYRREDILQTASEHKVPYISGICTISRLILLMERLLLFSKRSPLIEE